MEDALGSQKSSRGHEHALLGLEVWHSGSDDSDVHHFVHFSIVLLDFLDKVFGPLIVLPKPFKMTLLVSSFDSTWLIVPMGSL